MKKVSLYLVLTLSACAAGTAFIAYSISHPKVAICQKGAPLAEQGKLENDPEDPLISEGPDGEKKGGKINIIKTEIDAEELFPAGAVEEEEEEEEEEEGDED